MISAQPGPQTEFLRTPADVAIYGGAAGGGKTVGLILEPLRHVGRVANFTAVFFRRTMPPDNQPRGVMGRNPELLSAAGWDPACRSARVALAARQQDQVFAFAI